MRDNGLHRTEAVRMCLETTLNAGAPPGIYVRVDPKIAGQDAPHPGILLLPAS
jgi:hypothetical protein